MSKCPICDHKLRITSHTEEVVSVSVNLNESWVRHHIYETCDNCHRNFVDHSHPLRTKGRMEKGRIEKII